MKKNSIIIAFVGIVLIITGIVSYKLNFFDGGNNDINPPSNEPTPSSNTQSSEENFEESEEDIIINYSGKYYDNKKELDIYQLNDYELYFIVSNTIGKARIDNNHANGELNGKTYKLSIKKDVVTIESDDKSVIGSFIKSSDLSFSDFYGLKCGNINLLHSSYNGLRSNENIKITSYQISDNEIATFIDKNNSKEFVQFRINSDKSLTSIDSSKNYTIIMEDKYGANMKFSENGNEPEILQFVGEIVEEQVFDLYIEYNS